MVKMIVVMVVFGDVDDDIEDDYSATSDCTQSSLSSFHFQADTDMDGFTWVTKKTFLLSILLVV